MTHWQTWRAAQTESFRNEGSRGVCHKQVTSNTKHSKQVRVLTKPDHNSHTVNPKHDKIDAGDLTLALMTFVRGPSSQASKEGCFCFNSLRKSPPGP